MAEVILTGKPGTQIDGTFEPDLFDEIGPESYADLAKEDLSTLVQRAYSALRSVNKDVPGLDQSALEEIATFYQQNPNTELVFYFYEAAQGDRIRSAELSGTVGFTIVADSP